jgi:tetratricopeptide (TPR) repeat protein
MRTANAKIEALSGLGRNQEAMALASEAMQRASNYHLAGHLYELYQARAGVYGRMGQWDRAATDYSRAIQYAKQLSYWRGVTQADGLLAKTNLRQGKLRPALAAVDEAIEANKQIPDELYFVPRDLAIKAEILSKLGDAKSSDELYRKSTDLIDALLSKVPTPTVERQLLGQLSEVYAGYFASLSNRGKNREAFGAIERARDRLTADSISPSKFPYTLSISAFGFYKASILHASPFLHRRLGWFGRALSRQVPRLKSIRRRMHGSKDMRLLLCCGRVVLGKEGTFNDP